MAALVVPVVLRPSGLYRGDPAVFDVDGAAGTPVHLDVDQRESGDVLAVQVLLLAFAHRSARTESVSAPSFAAVCAGVLLLGAATGPESDGSVGRPWDSA